MSKPRIEHIPKPGGGYYERRYYGPGGAGCAERALSATDLERLWKIIEEKPALAGEREALARQIDGNADKLLAATRAAAASSDRQMQVFRNWAQSAAPYQTRTMREKDVYDLSTISGPALGYPRKVLIERAERAIDLARFPGADQETPKTILTEMLHRGETANFSSDQFARHILSTGSPAYRRAFLKTIESSGSGNPVTLTPEENLACWVRLQVRAMGVSTGAAGGFTSPFTLDPTLVPTSSGSRSPYRDVCRVEQTTGNEYRQPTSGGVVMSYQAEATQASDDSPTLAQPSLTLARAQGFVPLSAELYGDWNGALDQLSAEFQRAKADLETTKFTLGTGTGEPEGLITGATTTPGTGGAGTFVSGDLYAVEEALPARFRSNAQWFANKITLNRIRKFDTAGGADLITADGSAVLGYPANEVTAMVSTLTTGSKIAVLGDPQYFLIVDHVGGMEVELIPHLFGAAGRPTGSRGVYAIFRNTSKVLNPAAFRVLTTA